MAETIDEKHGLMYIVVSRRVHTETQQLNRSYLPNRSIPKIKLVS